jgi:hypothetical protein
VLIKDHFRPTVSRQKLAYCIILYKSAYLGNRAQNHGAIGHNMVSLENRDQTILSYQYVGFDLEIRHSVFPSATI